MNQDTIIADFSNNLSEFERIIADTDFFLNSNFICSTSDTSGD